MNPSPNRSSQMPNSSSSHPTQSSEQVVDMPQDLQMSVKQVQESSDIEQSTSPPSSVVETVSEITSDTSVSPDLSDPSETDEQLLDEANRFWQHPIPPPSEPRQYRAIGLIRGRYTASQDQFTQGILLTSDGTVIDAVLLGRVMSLVKKHLDLEQEHLWVVYPRTRQQEGNLHVQIMGVWEPETLKKEQESTLESSESAVEESTASEATSEEIAESSESSEPPESAVEESTASEATSEEVAETSESSEPPESSVEESTASERTSEEMAESSEFSVKESAEPAEDAAVEAAQPSILPVAPAPPEVEHGYFSIRGEVVYQSQDAEKYVIIKIRQSSRSEKDKPKFFKLKLDGLASPKVVGHFLDLHVQLKQDCLVIQESHDIGMIAQRRPGRPGGGRRPGGNRNFRGSRGPSRGSRPPFKSKPNFSQNRPEPISKPTKPKPKTQKD